MYKCKKCGLGVVVTKEATIKACKCKAPIVCDMSATATGKGGVRGQYGSTKLETTSGC